MEGANVRADTARSLRAAKRTYGSLRLFPLLVSGCRALVSGFAPMLYVPLSNPGGPGKIFAIWTNALGMLQIQETAITQL